MAWARQFGLLGPVQRARAFAAEHKKEEKRKKEKKKRKGPQQLICKI